MKFEILQNGAVIDTKELGEGSHKIGRSTECEIQLKSTRISKQHALLVVKGNKAAVVDMGSANGVFVNGILVRKQRIEAGDDVNIADFQLRLVLTAPPKPPQARAPGGESAAPASKYGAGPAGQPEEELKPQEKLLKLVDEKILVPYYAVMKTFDYRWVLASILIVALVSSVLLSVIPIVRWGKQTTEKEALARAHTIIGQTVRENFRILSKTNDFTRLTVEAAEAEEGILAAYVIDPKTNGVLAPTKEFNKTINDPYSLLAIKKIVEGKEEQSSVEQETNIYRIAQPIYIFSQEAGDRQLQAIVIGTFQINNGITSTFEPMVEASLFAVLMSLLAFFFIYKMMTRPITQMQEQLDAALKGDDVTISAETKFPELENLAQVINFTVSRIKEGGGVSAPIAGGDIDAEDAAYLKMVQEFEVGTSDGILLLDRDKKVRFVGKILEDLISLRGQYANGQNISDACRDQSFAGTVVDLADNVMTSLGENQFAMLDINGTSRNLAATGHKSLSGDIRYVLITVKMGGGA